MTTPHRIGSVLRLAGFLFLVAAVVPAFRGEGLNLTIFVVGIAFWIVGLVVGLKARAAGASPSADR